MSDPKSKRFPLLDVSQPTAFSPPARGSKGRSMLLLAAAAQATACTMGTEAPRDLGVVFDTGTFDGGISAIDQGIGPDQGPGDATTDGSQSADDAG